MKLLQKKKKKKKKKRRRKKIDAFSKMILLIKVLFLTPLLAGFLSYQ